MRPCDRHPQLLLVDELAHTNAPGCDTPSAGRTWRSCWRRASTCTRPSTSSTWRASTTWSRRSPACRSGRRSRSGASTTPTRSRWWTCPRGSWLERLRQGKVYIPAQAERALAGLLHPANLGALTGDRAQAHRRPGARASGDGATRGRRAAAEPGPIIGDPARLRRPQSDIGQGHPHLQAHGGIAGRPLDRRRSGRPAGERFRRRRQQRLMKNIQLAERLGAETATVSGDDIAEEIVSYARSQSATKIVIGKTAETALEAVSGPRASWTICSSRAATSTSMS